MKRSIFLVCLLAGMLPVRANSQQQDTSSFFPLGLWAIWVDHSRAPYGDSIPTQLSAQDWQKELGNWSNINASYMIAWIPDWLEDTVMTLTEPMGYKLDIARSSWYQAGRADSSLRGYVQFTSAPLSDSWKTGANDRIDWIRNKFGTRTGFHSYLVAHESDFWAYASDTTWWPAIGYVIDRIKQVDPHHKSYVVNGSLRFGLFPYGITLSQFAQRFPNLGIYQVDDYVFRPWRSIFYSDQQEALDTLLISYNDCMVAFKERSTEWHAVIQTQREYINSSSNMLVRRPNIYEIKVQAYLALSRGARGITSYIYGSSPFPTGVNPKNLLTSSQSFLANDKLVSHGLVSLTRDAYSSGNPDAEGFAAFENVSNVFNEIKFLGPIIRKLKVYNAFSNTSIPSNSARIYSASGDKIEIGTFKRVDEGSDSSSYFILVNRVCNTANGSVADTQVVWTAIAGNKMLKEQRSQQVISGSYDGGTNRTTFSMSLEPGEGKLYKIIATPVAPTLASPSNGATGVAVAATLNWSSSTGATSYHVQLSTSPSFSTLALNDSTVVGTSRQVSLSYSTTYYWRVRTRNEGGWSGFSTSRYFTTHPEYVEIYSAHGTGGTISPLGSVWVPYDNEQGFTITPNTGYHIDFVMTSDQGNVGAVSTYAFYNVTTEQSISAVFAINTYTITASAGSGGSISPSGGVQVDHGGSQSFSISANTGYSIADVSVNGNSQGPISSYEFSNVTSNHTISATFTPTMYTISASAGSGGSISPSGSVQVTQGNNQTFNISPNTGYNISNVVIDGGSYGVVWQYTFANVTENHTISASFQACEQASAPQWVDAYFAGPNLYARVDVSWDFLYGTCAAAGFNIYRAHEGTGYQWELIAYVSAGGSWMYEDYVPYPGQDMVYEYYVTTIDILGRESGPSAIAYAWP